MREHAVPAIFNPSTRFAIFPYGAVRNTKIQDDKGLSLWQRIQRNANGIFESIQEEAKRMDHGGEKDEVNAWLQRAGWRKYLMEYNREE